MTRVIEATKLNFKEDELMRIAVLSDIHSNLYALEAVVADIENRGVDVVVNLGDILYGPIAPRATYERLRELDFVTICGNQDRQIYQASAADCATNPTMQFILDDLGPEPLQWMQQLPFDLQLNEQVYLCHASPGDDLIYLVDDVSQGFAQLRSEHEILALLEGQTSPLILCGHSHTPRVVNIGEQQLLVNPGSVGLQAYRDDWPNSHVMENFSPHARYAIVELTAQGWTVAQYQVAYDIQKAVALAELRGRDDWAYALVSGRASN
ncbi:metallophosphoesterase family protein [Agarivorans sp. QJM3NY_25]|uniref:metallophosphoesterase family protein n=1 Tax=Agarivorans sp. QJM3NY_25 TaxID=3421430 RepID=UPI003D7E2A3D